MQIDPVAEWQRLTEFYRAKDDEELEELAEDFGNLTETAQDVLKTELRSRGLSLPAHNQQPDNAPAQALGDTRLPSSIDPDDFAPDSDDVSDADLDGEPAYEFTWKTPLYACDEASEAWQISEVLRRAGIESWIARKGARNVVVWDETMGGRIQVLVAADQLDEAREIAARPIPQDIVEESKDLDAPVEDFVPPTCPQCHTEDPVLESSDPSNNWLCEACGARWSDSVPDEGSEPAGSSK
jgi:hypothetical protein